MEMLAMCWIFDKRWFFSLTNPCLEFLMIVPIVANGISLITMELQRGVVEKRNGSGLAVMISWAVLLAVELGFMLLVYGVAEDKLRSSGEGVSHYRVRTFMHHFQAKQKIWGWMGLLLTLLTIAQVVINRVYIGDHIPCLTNKIRLVSDLVCLGYIAVVILVFLASKIGFLVMAWLNPQNYLKYKEVI